jgi:D-aminopeptidase
VTVILPSGQRSWHDYVFAGCHTFTGNGEMTGMHWLNEAGLLCTPIGITNTFEVGIVRDALIKYAHRQGYPESPSSELPVVAETYDGWLSDIAGFHLSDADIYTALDGAAPGPVSEGSVGGGTGMICFGFKGGIGTASRVVSIEGETYTVGVLVQTNFGDRRALRVNGVPVGLHIGQTSPPLPWSTPERGGSLIVIIATDAPLLPIQCQRLARQATIGFARVGGLGRNADGDIILALSTGNKIPHDNLTVQPVGMLANATIDPLFDAVGESTEEAILNSMCAAETMTGFKGRTAHALPLEQLMDILKQYPGGSW